MKNCKFKIGENVLIIKDGRFLGVKARIQEIDLERETEYLVLTEYGAKYWFEEKELKQ